MFCFTDETAIIFHFQQMKGLEATVVLTAIVLIPWAGFTAGMKQRAE